MNLKTIIIFIIIQECGLQVFGYSLLNLPWELGAEFFMKYLLDGDSASNTLGRWRWVAGIQTKGKNYLANEWNIKNLLIIDLIN